MLDESGASASTQRLSNRYWHFLAGYLALNALGFAALAFLVERSTMLLTAVEVVAAFVLLVLASVAAVPALYRDAAAVRAADVDWTPGWQKYVGFSLASPVVVYLYVGYVASAQVALLAAGVAFVLGTAESSAVYVYNRYRRVGTSA